MPEPTQSWLEIFVAPIVTAVAVGVIVGYFSHRITLRASHRKSVRDRLRDRYAALVGVCTDELYRSRSVEAALATQFPKDSPQFETHLRYMQELETERGDNRRRIAALSLQIRLEEQDATLSDRVESLKANELYIHPVAVWGHPGFEKRYDRFVDRIQAFEAALTTLADEVREEYSKA